MSDNKLTPIENDWPIEQALCVFKTKRGFYFLGYLQENRILSEEVKIYGSEKNGSVKDLESYQYVINEQGGFLFIKK